MKVPGRGGGARGVGGGGEGGPLGSLNICKMTQKVGLRMRLKCEQSHLKQIVFV